MQCAEFIFISWKSIIVLANCAPSWNGEALDTFILMVNAFHSVEEIGILLIIRHGRVPTKFVVHNSQQYQRLWHEFIGWHFADFIPSDGNIWRSYIGCLGIVSLQIRSRSGTAVPSTNDRCHAGQCSQIYECLNENEGHSVIATICPAATVKLRGI